MNFIYRTHAIERMFQRDISEDSVESVVKNGKIIEEYLEDKPFASFLAVGFEDGDETKPIHVVYAKNENDVIIITAYRPHKSKWTNDFQKRIKK